MFDISIVDGRLVLSGTSDATNPAGLAISLLSGSGLSVQDSGESGIGAGPVVYELDPAAAALLSGLDLGGLTGVGGYVNWRGQQPGSLIGSAQNDTMAAYGLQDVTLSGGAGQDALASYGGSGYLDGGSGNDTLLGWEGHDVLVAGLGDDEIFGHSGQDTLIFAGQRAEYEISFHGGIHTVTHLGGGVDGIDRVRHVERFVFADQTLEITQPSDLVVARAGAVLSVSGQASTEGTGLIRVANSHAQSIQIHDVGSEGEGSGAMILDDDGTLAAGLTTLDLSGLQGAGAAAFWSLATAGKIIGSNQADSLGTLGAGQITILGGLGDDTMVGGRGANLLSGGQGADQLFGMEGDDTLSGGRGNDTINGGAGQDILRLSGAKAEYNISYVDGAFRIAHARGTRLDGVDTVSLVETLEFADQTMALETPTGLNARVEGKTLVVSGLAAEAGSGQISVKTLGGQSIAVFDRGTQGTGSGPTVYEADAATAAGLNQLDLRGLINAGAYAGWTLSQTGSVLGSNFSDVLTAYGTGLVRLYGNGGADQLAGGAGNNFLNGGHGNDSLYGDRGNDTLIGGRGRDLVEGGAGEDTIIFRGERSEYDIRSDAGMLKISHTGGTQFDGVDFVQNVEQFIFGTTSYAYSDLI